MKTNLMVFIAGDNNLDTFGTADIKEMMSVSDTGDKLSILVQQDQSVMASNSGTKRYVIQNGVKEKTIDLGETNTGDANTLTEFIQWGLTNYKADRNIVVLWNHGGGTRDEVYSQYDNNETTIESLKHQSIERVRLAPIRAIRKPIVRAMNLNPTLGNQSSFFPQKLRLKRIKSLMKVYQQEHGEPNQELLEIELKSILFDDQSRDFLDNIELKKVFDDVGQKIDIIGFDACLMGMIEVAYQLKDHTEIVVGSEELEPGKGWDYTALVSYLVNNPTASNEDVSKAMVNSFMASYEDESSLKATLSSIRTDKLAHVVCLMDRFAYTILRNESNVRGELLAIVDETATFDYVNNEQIYRDLAHFVTLTKNHYVNNSEIVSSADNLLAGLSELIVENKTKNSDNAHGLSVYLPLVPNMSDFAIAVFSALEINQAKAAPHWLKLFKQIGHLDEEANNFYGGEPLSMCPEMQLVDDKKEYPEANPNREFTDLVEIPKHINKGLHGSQNRDLIKLLGLPKCHGSATTGKVEQRFKRRYKPLNFKTNVNGFDLAVDSFKEVLSEIEVVYPKLAASLDTIGMAVCRPVRGGQSYSNHSWGIAIDLLINGKLDRRGNHLVQYGLTLIAPIFNKHGWYWGAGFTIEDAMHFEISQEKMYQWAKEGRLFSASTHQKPDNTVLRLGDRSYEVQLLQKRLNNLGYDLIVDGIFGQGTYHVVYDFQITHGLMADGIVGHHTMTLIESLNNTRPIKVIEHLKFTLTFGMRNRSVQIAQEYLNGYGFELIENGVFDKLMLQAVLDYQKAYNLEENGRVNDAVWKKLENPTRTKKNIVRTYPISSLEDQNEEVYRLQSALKVKGFNLEVSGYFDRETQNVVKKLQAYNFLEPTGEVDTATRKMIMD